MKNIKLPRIFVWDYPETSKGYAGWHLTADEDGCSVIIKGGEGYALLPLAGSCSQDVEILTPDGQSRGFVSFPQLSGDCGSTSLDVGLDGTVIQELPAGGGCSWRYWPAFFQ